MNDNLHYMDLESLSFEEFIYRSLLKNNKVIKSSANDEKYDLFCPNGIIDLCNEECYVEVKYANNVSLLQKYQNYKGPKLVIFILVENPNIKNKNIITPSMDYILNLVKNNLKEWWDFAVSSARYPVIIANDNNKQLKLNFKPLAYSLLGEPCLSYSGVNELGNMNKEKLKRSIKEGLDKVSLFIGNGISIPFGSDPWIKMTSTLYDLLTPKFVNSGDKVKEKIGNNVFSTSSLVKYFIDDEKYKRAIRECIYRKYDDDMHQPGTLVRMISVIKEKYPKVDLVTYNYDEFIEKDYELQFNKKINSEIRTSHGIQEPKITHVHGLIPIDGEFNIKDIVLSQEDYYEAYKNGEWTHDIQFDLLKNKTVIFVGSSLSDLFQMSLINEVKNSGEKNKELCVCYALLCLNGLCEKDKAAIYGYFAYKGIRIIFTDSYEKLPLELKDIFEV